MKAMIVRSVYALVAAVVVAGGMLMAAKPAAADEPAAECFLITHYTKWSSQEIVIDAPGWHGHAKHGDDWLANVNCETGEVLPPV